MRFLLMLISFTMISCYSRITPTNKFRDIDYVQLVGKDELAQDELMQYPYFEIVQINPLLKELRLWRSANDTSSHIFQKVKGRWSYVEMEEEEEDYTRYMCEILEAPDNVLQFNFEKRLNGKTYLLGVSVSHSSGSFYYRFGLDREITNISLEDYPSMEQLLQETRPLTVQKMTYALNGSILKSNLSIQEGDGSSIVSIDKCYNLEKWGHVYSATWWNFFRENEIPCN